MNISRRKAVVGLLSASAVLTSRRSSARSLRSVDVVIMGGGFAGLNAAILLQEQGLKVALLEAANRPGGRSNTAYHLDSRIELGASQIGPMYARVRDMAQKLAVPLAPGAHINAPYCYVVGDQLIGAKDWAGSKYNPLQGDERAVPPQALSAFYVERRTPFEALDDWLAPAARQFDLSLQEWLQRQGASISAQRLINHTLGEPGLETVGLLRMLQEATRSRADVKAVASLPGMEDKDVYERFALTSSHVVGGNSVLTDKMAASLGDSVYLQHQVISIDMGDTFAEVATANGDRWRCARVISAVPFAALRNVRISPSLPGAQGDAVRRMHYNNQSQVWLRVKAPYWEADGLEASMWTDGPFSLIRQQIEYDGKKELMSVLSFGNKSKAVDALSPKERGELAIRYIEGVRPSTKGKLEFLGAHSWAEDPLHGGCSHTLMPWRAADWSTSMSKPYRLMHFAGEHTRRLEVGMESAMESGERTALEVLERMS